MRLVLMTVMICISAPAMATPTPKTAMDDLSLSEKTLTKDLTSDQKDQFNKIRTAHGTIRAIEDVQLSLDRAVKSCATAHVDLAKPMQDIFQEWKNVVLPLVRRGQTRLDKMIQNQRFTQPESIRAYLHDFDAAVAMQGSFAVEVPVKERAACTMMQKNMGHSAQTIGVLIIDTLGLDQGKATGSSPPEPPISVPRK